VKTKEDRTLENKPEHPSRREFLKSSTGIASLFIAPGVMLYKAGEARSVDAPASSSIRWGMLIDTNIMTEDDVDTCVTACQTEHGWKSTGNPDTDAQWIRKVNLQDKNTGYKLSLPMMCQHCEDPPCVDVCPTGASFKRADGIVLVNKHTCIGCRYCMIACPYKARSFVHENLTDQLPTAPRGKGTVESCTLCVHRIDRDGVNAVPACAEAVNSVVNSAVNSNEPHKPIIFGDLNDPESEISKKLEVLGGKQLRADLGLNPGIRYLGL
jgi:tetrathionate reductase subunit B